MFWFCKKIDIFKGKKKHPLSSMPHWNKALKGIKEWPLNWGFDPSEYKYISDGDKDYWKTPNEFYIDGGGDCEDFAIFKMANSKKDHALSEMHIGVYTRRDGQHHAVLIMGNKVYDCNRKHLVRLSKNYKFFIIYSYDGVWI